MNLEKLRKAFGRISDAIRRFFGRPGSATGNTPVNGSKPPNQGKSPKSDPSQLGVEPSNPESSTSSKNPGSPNSGDDIPGEDISSPKDQEKTPKPPPSMPGTRGTQKTPKRKRSPPEEKPELICRETRDRSKWEIFLTTPQGKSFVVSQNKAELPAGDNDEYLLTNFKERIHWTDNKNDEEIELFSNNRPLIFKLRKEWNGDGHHVPRISSGYYLVFTPRDWRRINKATVSPPECTDRDFLAHYFYSDGTGTTDGFKECNSFTKQERFSLDGTTVADDANMGELYVGDIPKLNDSENWKGISWIQIGKEGDDKWAANFKPNESTLADVLQSREGWFFIRIYDEDVKLIHSMDFRYLEDLEKILVNGEPHHSDNILTPDDNGYVDAVIQFVGEIRVESENKDIAINKDHTAIIDSLPNLDKTQWTLIGKNGRVTIILHLPRIWWKLVNSKTISEEWNDTPFEMSQGAFIDNRESVMIVRLPPAKREMWVSFGKFNQYDGGRKYDKDRKTSEARFDLREFCNHQQITEISSGESNLSIQCGSVDFPIVRILANKPAQPTAPIPPVSNIRYSKKGFAYPDTGNKRFSRAECDKARLTDDDVKRLKISVDSRRGTKHDYNVSLLRNLQEKNHAT